MLLRIFYTNPTQLTKIGVLHFTNNRSFTIPGNTSFSINLTIDYLTHFETHDKSALLLFQILAMMKSNKNSILLLALFLSIADLSEVKGFTAGPAFAPLSSFKGKLTLNPFQQDLQLRPKTRKRTFTQRNMIAPSTIQILSLDISVVSNSNVEVEVFSDLAHLLLDFATMFSPNTIMLKLLILCGRVFSILSDLTPDGSITTDEFVFQSSMLAIASYNVVNMFEPLFHAAMQDVSFQDRRIYQRVFRSAGFTWSQFKYLLANGSLEWVDVPPNSALIEPIENLLIPYQGSVHMMDPKRQDHMVYGQRTGDKAHPMHEFIGDLNCTKSIVDAYGIKKKEKKADLQDRSDVQILSSEHGVSRLLRINTKRILETSRKDPRLDSSIKNFFFKAILSLCESYALESQPYSSDTFGNNTDDSVPYSYV